MAASLALLLLVGGKDNCTGGGEAETNWTSV